MAATWTAEKGWHDSDDTFKVTTDGSRIKITNVTVEQLWGRVAALEPLETYGPSYNRNVSASLNDVRLFLRRGETRTAEHYLLTAEMRAGLMTFEEWERAIAALNGR